MRKAAAAAPSDNGGNCYASCQAYEIAKCLSELEAAVPFGVGKFKENDDDMAFYTGLLSYNHFLCLVDFLDPGEGGKNILRTDSANSSSRTSKQPLGRPQKLSVEDQLFVILVKLRLGLFHRHLGHLFQ